MVRKFLLLLVLGGCDGVSSPSDSAPPGAATTVAARPPERPAGIAIRSGDTLLDHLAEARLDLGGSSNLPAELEKLFAEPVHMRTAILPAADWIEAGPVPPKINALLPRDHRTRYWQTKPVLSQASGQRPVEVLLGDVAAPRPDGSLIVPGEGELPSPLPAVPVPSMWWDARLNSILALSETAPEGVRVDYWGDPLSELPACERLRRSGEPITARALTRRVEIGKVDRPSLLLPSTSSITFPLARLDVDELSFAVGVIDEAFRKSGDYVEPATGLCDGVTFTVQVDCDGATQTLWTRELARERVGQGFIEVRVDLARFRGKELSLRLATLPGPAGDPAFDYAVWSGLRLYGAPAAAPTRPHILFIDIDTLRADRLGCYGNRRATSPGIDGFAAKDAVVYSDVLATAPWTLPSTASMVTGLYVHQHGANLFPKALSASTPTLAVLLAAYGYEAYGIAEGGYVRAAFGFSRGFDVYDCTRYKKPDWKPALDWLRARRSELPFFLFLHTYLVHAPYRFDPRFEHESEPPYAGWLAGKEVGYDNVIEPFNRKALDLSDSDRAYVNRLYDALVADADREVAGVIAEVQQIVGDQELLVVVTSDHGEEFFEHGQMGHGQSLHGELLHVPLIIRYPRSLAARPTGVDDTRVSSVDIVPTILDAVGLPCPDYLPGRSLLHIDDETSPRLAYQSAFVEAIDQAGYKMMLYTNQGESAKPFEFFHVEEDRSEAINLLDQRADLVVRLQDLFIRLKEKLPPVFQGGENDAVLAEDAMNQLRELGYLNGEGGR